jgi:lipid-binding SYLF domain-containing protein
MRTTLISILLLSVLSLTPFSLLAQNAVPTKFNDAIKRSQSAAEIVAKLTEPSDKGISKLLVDATEAIGIFPCHRQDVLVEYAVLCPGVISRHLQKGWSIPVFYKFAGAGFGRPGPALGETTAIVLLFIDKQSIDWLSKPFKLEEEKEARAGQLGPLTEAQLANLITNNHIVAYSIRKDGLKGVILSGGFEKVIAIDQDNHINHGLYVLKGSEILSGKEVTITNLSSEVFSFQKALQKHFAR